ncbi:MAG: DNA-binding response regulator [Terriglobia bacterium]|nr:MAG: DNA-binding response regulator [Terriglobia bacterium]
MVDGDARLCKLMADLFASHEFQLTAVHDGMTALSKGMEGGHDLILLDVMLPMMDGFEVLRRLRESRIHTPVIFLTGRTAHRDRIAGLDAGADDYVPKPFAPHELLARVRAVLRRTDQIPAAAPVAVEVGKIRVDPRRREVWKGKNRIEVTSAEFDILDALMHSAGRIVSRDRLAADLCRGELTSSYRFIDVHISHLRKKLESGRQPLIRSVRGVGYLFVPPEEHES